MLASHYKRRQNVLQEVLAMNRKQKEKTCPLLNEACLQKRCKLYNPVLNNCEFSVIAYNLFMNKQAMEGLTKALNNLPE